MEFSFAKMQGVGNDFVVIDGRGQAGIVWNEAAVTLCDRKFGVGADGLLVLDESDKADFLMRMHNPDGSPDVCGNGLRCIARYARDCGIIGRDSMNIETFLDVREVQINRNAASRFESVTVDMGQPHWEAQAIPADLKADERIMDYALPLANGESLTITALSTGSTHAVTFINELPADADFFRISPLAENHLLFPERTSLMWCKVENANHLRLRIWERGAGETWGCGTGACAAAVAALQHGFGERSLPVTVVSRGGELRIFWTLGNRITMTGPAEFVFDGVYYRPA